jgi:hypothetical protein
MTPRKITQVLHSLPRDLEETYERILSKVSKENSEEALSALRWISLATRPLFVEELIDACAIHYAMDINADEQFDPEDRYSPSSILDLLPGLITIDPPLEMYESFSHGLHRVTFSHFSVQEYLLGERIKSSPAQMYSSDTRYSNHFIGKSCLAYLLCCNSIALRKDSFPLREYAWDYWAWHTEFEEGKTTQEVGICAETVFSAIAHQDLVKSIASLEALIARLSYIARWKELSISKKQQLLECLRVPFFYEEFSISQWNDAASADPALALLYKYQPLRPDRQEIRLVELFPSPKPFTEIRCMIRTVSLKNNPLYDGLSYVWGDPLDVSPVRVNGLLLQVPRNLFTVLRNLRSKNDHERRVLFIDAMCFDRHVDLEKNIQEREMRVRLMPQIFKQAQQVAIGLGEKNEADAKAIEFVQKVTSKSLIEANAQEVISLDIVPKMKEPFLQHDEKLGSSILNLFQRPWWLRSWPIQEAVLSVKATLYYGDMAVTFDPFEKFFQMEDALREHLGDASYTELVSNKAWIGAKRVSMVRANYAQGHTPELPELLGATQFHQARLPRDKIYTLIGLLPANDQTDDLLLSDDSLSDGELFTRVATSILKKQPNLDILSYASNHPFERLATDRTIPSWVPNFGVGQCTVPLINGVFGAYKSKDLFNAGRQDGPPGLRLETDPTRLIVAGFKFDTIQVICDAFMAKKSKDEVLKRYSMLENAGIVIKIPQGQSKHEAYWRTIHIDQRKGCRLNGDAEAEFQVLLNNSNKDANSAQNDELLDLLYAEGRRPFLTSQGYLGLGPGEAKIGDVISVIPGGKVLYVLQGSSDFYGFVGEWFA